MKRVLISIGLVIFILGCDEENGNSPRSETYLPLAIGNTWKFNSTRPGTEEGYSFKRITSKVNLNDHTYYEIVSGYATPDEVIVDTTFYRIDAKGYVFSLRKSGDLEENRFRLYGTDGDSWKYPIDNSRDASVALSVVTLHVGDRDLNHCKAYFYDVETMADEEYTITLAKGIGFVKEYSDAWGNGSILKSAIINGREILF